MERGSRRRHRPGERPELGPARAADPAGGYDFVSRCSFPNVGIDEDPVTGSAHTALAPFWSERLGRPALTGLQASPRSGLVRTELRGDRTLLVITGKGLKKTDDLRILDRGVLRAMLPIWLAEPALAPYIAGYDSAAQGHGGEGAFYVRLRRVAK